MADPYDGWIAKESGEQAKRERLDREQRHTPPDTVRPVQFVIDCDLAGHGETFDRLDDAVNYVRSMLIAGVAIKCRTEVVE